MNKTLLNLDFNLLQVLAILLAEKSVTGAAKRLSLTQSAVSKHLARLRLMFNDPLFERSPRGLKPTPRLTLLAPQLRQILQQLEQLTRPVEFDPATNERRFNMHLLETAYPLCFPFFMPTLLNQAANIRLSAQTWNEHSLDLLINCEVDLGIACREWDERSAIHIRHLPAELHYVELVRDVSVCLVRDDHPALRGEWDLDKFLQYRHIQVTFGGMESWLLDDVLSIEGISRDIAINLTDFQSAMSLCEQSDLILCAPARHSEAMLKHYRLKLLPVPVHMEAGAYVLLWHKHFEQDPGHRWLRELIVERVKRSQQGA